MANLIDKFTVGSRVYYYFDNHHIQTVNDGGNSRSLPDPFNHRMELGRYTIKGRECLLYSDGTYVDVQTGKTPTNESIIQTVSNQALEDYKIRSESEEKELSVSDYEDMYGKFINDGNYSANIVADPKYNFNTSDKSDGDKITKFIDDMEVISRDGGSLDITDSKLYRGLLASKNLLPPKNEDLFTKTFRFGYYNLEAPLTRVREYLFFTKPDLNILVKNLDPTDGDNPEALESEVREIYKTLDVKTENELWVLNPGLLTPFWADMLKSRRRIIKCLQSSYTEDTDRKDPFIHLLANQVNTNLEIPELSADVVETGTNRYGTSIFYRGSSEPSDDGLSFSLEFKDTKWLDVYYFFRAYEEYETAKHLGTTLVNPEYIRDKVLYDQMALYKIVVDLDMETILYWGKYYGVTPMSLPRDTFSSDTFDNGLSYTIQFKAQFYEDMKPEILSDFNALSKDIFGSAGSADQDPSGNGYNRTTGSSLMYDLRPYNPVLGRVDNRPAIAAHVSKVIKSRRAKQSPNGYVYKLRWRGVDRY